MWSRVTSVQAEKAALQQQLDCKTAEANTASSDLTQSAAECRQLTQSLGNTQAELASAIEQTQQQADLQAQRAKSAAREADSASELESARGQAARLGRQLSERIQKLDKLQVCINVILYSNFS